MEQFLRQALNSWQDWGVFVGLVIVLGVAGWVFYDAQRKSIEATVWKVIAVVATVLVIPSLLFKIPNLRSSPNLQGAVGPLGYLGIVAGLAALIALITYLVMGARRQPRCPNCGREWLDPNWPHCPYCGYGKAVPTAGPTPIQETPLSTTAPDGTPAIETAVSPRSVETVVLGREAKPALLAWLVVRSGLRAGKEFPLGEVTNIGRDAAQNDVVLDDEALSRQHARVKLEEGRFLLYDLASANGTFVQDKANGVWRRIQKRSLKDHDNVKMGETLFTFMQVVDKKSSKA